MLGMRRSGGEVGGGGEMHEKIRKKLKKLVDLAIKVKRIAIFV